MSNSSYIVAAYALTWVVILTYTVRLVRRVAHAERSAESARRGSAS